MLKTKDIIQQHIENSIRTKEMTAKTLLSEIEQAAQWIIDALKNGNKILFFGNGGSASDAQHMAAEFVGRYEKDRRALPAIALTTDTSILTSISNDYSFNTVFSRQIEALGKKGDVAVGISTSGASNNVNIAIDRAKTLGLKTIALTGKNGGSLKQKADLVLLVPSDVTSRIQEVHIMIGHIICDLVDRSLITP